MVSWVVADCHNHDGGRRQTDVGADLEHLEISYTPSRAQSLGMAEHAWSLTLSETMDIKREVCAWNSKHEHVRSSMENMPWLMGSHP